MPAVPVSPCLAFGSISNLLHFAFDLGECDNENASDVLPCSFQHVGAGIHMVLHPHLLFCTVSLINSILIYSFRATEMNGSPVSWQLAPRLRSLECIS
jgi:hypothetical protein